tara:strand:- start:44 stop:592 length:549 start_codon:yes stop_codon:yes gene_type:complete
MKTLIKILCLSVFSICLGNDLNPSTNIYTVIIESSNNETIKYESIYFVEKTLFTFIFKDNVGNIIEIKKKEIKSIYDSNNNYIHTDQLTSTEFKNNNPSNKTNQELVISAGKHLEKFTRLYYLGLFLTAAGSVSAILDVDDGEINTPKVSAGLSTAGFILQIISVTQVGQAGKELQSVKIED